MNYLKPIAALMAMAALGGCYGQPPGWHRGWHRGDHYGHHGWYDEHNGWRGEWHRGHWDHY